MNLFSTSVRPFIDQWLLDESKKVRDYGPYWSASSAGQCMRRTIFQRLKVPPTTENARKQRVFTSGHLFHDWIQGITKETGLSIAQELELQDEDLMIRGHIDDLVLLPIDTAKSELMTKVMQHSMKDTKYEEISKHAKVKEKHLILYDYKTAHSKWFEYAKGRPMSYYNKMQLGTYMYMLRNKGHFDVKKTIKAAVGDKKYKNYPDLTEARILKISKDDLRMYEQQLLWSEELEAMVIKYWTELNQAWEAKVLPPCSCKLYENGFLATEKYNDYFYEGQPCSIEYYKKWKKGKTDAAIKV